MWTVSITNVDVDSKRADVSAVRVDGEVTESYKLKGAIIGTTLQRQAVLQQIWDSHLAAQTKQTAIDAFITNLEDTAKANLEGRE